MSQADEQPTLTDGVIVLNSFTDDDIDAHLAGEDEEHARRFGWFPARSTRETVATAVRRWRTSWDGDRSVVAFAARIDGDLAGGCEVRRRDDGACEMSYWVFPSHRRRGIATRAARLIAAWAFASPGIERLELHVEPDNTASRGVALGAGFREEGLVRERAGSGEQRDMVVYTRISPQRRPSPDPARDRG